MPEIKLVERSHEAQMAYLEGFQAALRLAINRLRQPDADAASAAESLTSYMTGVEQSIRARTDNAN